MKNNLKVALVHDYIKEYGGAERVLRVFADMFPDAPIYTAFYVKNSTAAKHFSDRKIIESCWAWVIKHGNLYSPLRFLLPSIWKSIDLSDFDLVITSCSGYIARGFKKGDKTKVIAYCHTPPRFLYGYQTSINWQKYWLVRLYALIVNHFLRIFDFESAQEVDYWIVNSKNVAARVKKFYRKDSTVIYPPVEVDALIKASKEVKKEDYFFIAARLVGGKGLEQAVKAAVAAEVKLKIAGEQAGWAGTKKKLELFIGDGIELLGRVTDKKLFDLYAKAKGFVALEKDVDFGMTPVEAMAAGTPVIALDSGGYKETVIDGKTGVRVANTKVTSLQRAIDRFDRVKWDKNVLQSHARKFSKERFEKQLQLFLKNRVK